MELAVADICQAELILARRWTPSILMVMLEAGRPLRYTELARSVPGLSRRLLTERLTELEEAGLVVRQVGTGRPVTVIYTLSDYGASLRATFRELRTWIKQQPA
jgi:DNA-binding HxlR family transcriptional regulator